MISVNEGLVLPALIAFPYGPKQVRAFDSLHAVAIEISRRPRSISATGPEASVAVVHRRLAIRVLIYSFQ